MLAKLNKMREIGNKFTDSSYKMLDITSGLTDIFAMFLYESDIYYDIQQRLANVIITLEQYADVQVKLGELLCDIADLYEKTDKKITQYYDEFYYGIKPPETFLQFVKRTAQTGLAKLIPGGV